MTGGGNHARKAASGNDARTLRNAHHLRGILGVVLGIALPTSLLLSPVITASAASRHITPPAAVVLTPNTGVPTTPFTVVGSHFKAHEVVDLTFDTTAEVPATASTSGSFSASLTVPGSAVPGPHWVRAVGQADGVTAEAAFTVVINWSAFRNGPLHNGVNPYENIVNTSNVGGLAEQWSDNTGGSVESSPTVVGNVVYVGSDNDKVYALNAFTGAVLWSYTTGGSVFSSPAVAGGLVYVGSDDGNVYALNASTGTVRWSYNTGFAVQSSPEVVGSVVYVGSENDKVYALNGATGSVMWSYTAGDLVYASPAVANGVVYVTSLDGVVAALNATNGFLLWTYTTNDVIYSSPAVVNGIVYVGSFDGNVYAIGATSGLALWVYTTGNAVYSSPAVNSGIVYIGSNDGHLYALNATTGLVVWSRLTGGGVESSPAVANGVVYVGSNDHHVYAFNAATGVPLWSHGTAGQVFSSPAVSSGVLYAGSDDGTISSFSTPPVVVSTVPVDGAGPVLATTDPSITFDEAVNVTSSAFTIECPTGTPETFTLSPAVPGGASTYILTPTVPLPFGAVCTVTVNPSQVTDLGGIAMTSGYSFSFTVDTPPVIVSTTPLNGAIAVLASTDPTITFNKAVNVTASAFTLDCPTPTKTPFTLEPAAPGGVATYTLQPTKALPFGKVCTVSVIAADVADLIGTNLQANYAYSFTVDTPPVVASTYPLNKAKSVLATVDPTVTFNKAVDISATAFTLVCGAQATETFTVSPAAPGGVTTYTLIPAAALPAGQVCKVTVVATQVADLAGTALAANHVSSFTVDTPPVVVSESPHNGASGISLSVHPRVTFNKAVDVTSGAFTLACPSALVPFTLTPAVPGGVTTYTLTPLSPLPAGQICTVTVYVSQVHDLAGTVMTTFFTFWFKTA